MSGLLEEQFAELLLRFRHRNLPLTTAISELTRLAMRPTVISDTELQSLLSRITEAHHAGTLKTHATGLWANAPTGCAIAEQFGVGKTKLRSVRDAYYTLCLGIRPFDADEPQETEEG